MFRVDERQRSICDFSLRKCSGKAFGVGHRHPQRRVVVQPDHTLHLAVELDAESSTVIRAEGQTVIGEAESEPDSSPPAMRSRDLRPDDVGSGCLDREVPEGRPHDVGAHGDAVIVADAQREQEQLPAFVTLIGEERVRHVFNVCHEQGHIAIVTVPAVNTSYLVTIMQTPDRHRLEVLRNARLEVDGTGRIASIEVADSDACADVILPPTTVLIPGLVDTHIHAPQWPQLGTGLDLPLETWLFEHTFPLEARLTQPEFASEVWPDMVATLLAHGTTTAVYYATTSVETTTMLASACVDAGQRALVGRVAMDHPDGTPSWYRDEHAAAGIAASAQSIEEIAALESPLVEPIITPRFTPACTDELLAGLGELAGEMGVRVQTHCSESDWEHGYAFDRFGESDTAALDGFGLVRDHSVMAHGDHLGDEDMAVLAARGAGVAHCPLSNAYFANAVFPARRALDAGVRVGLGTDIAGGAQPGLLSQCSDAVTMSRLLEDGVDGGRASEDRGVSNSRISITDAFWMATLGGADLLGLDVGLLEVGRHFDAVAVDTARLGSALRVWPGVDDDARAFEKIIRLATPPDIAHVWVGGRRVAGWAESEDR